MSFLISIVKPVAYISFPLIILRQVAISSSFGRYYARVAIYLGTVVSVASISIFTSAALCLFGRSTDSNHLTSRMFYAVASRALDLKVEVEGEEHLRTCPTVIMGNHQSMLDILILGKLIPKRSVIMAKKSLKYTPLGPFMLLSGSIFINRGNSASAFRSIDLAGEKMKRDKTSIWIFPEGTRHMSKTPDMLPLKKGGFHLAINADIPITPVVTENYWHIYRKDIFESGVIKVKVLPPISTTGLSANDVGSLSALVRDTMVEALRDISRKDASEKEDIQSEEKHSYSSTALGGGGPLEATAALVPPSAIGVASESLEGLLETKGSSSSLASSSISLPGQRRSSEAGTETEEDEGMILVGRPAS